MMAAGESQNLLQDFVIMSHKDSQGHDNPNPQVAFVVAVRLVILLPSSATDKINEGVTIKRSGGPNVWPGVLRDVLG